MTADGTDHAIMYSATVVGLGLFTLLFSGVTTCNVFHNIHGQSFWPQRKMGPNK